MSEFEDRINSVLNDPEQMDKIANLAKSLMGGEATREAPSDEGGMLGKIGELAKGLMGGDTPDKGGMDIDPAMLGRISSLVSAGSKQNSDQRALLEAMKPYMSEKRRQKMDKALKIAQLARIARLAMGEMGGGDV